MKKKFFFLSLLILLAAVLFSEPLRFVYMMDASESMNDFREYLYDVLLSDIDSATQVEIYEYDTEIRSIARMEADIEAGIIQYLENYSPHAIYTDTLTALDQLTALYSGSPSDEGQIRIIWITDQIFDPPEESIYFNSRNEYEVLFEEKSEFLSNLFELVMVNVPEDLWNFTETASYDQEREENQTNFNRTEYEEESDSPAQPALSSSNESLSTTTDYTNPISDTSVNRVTPLIPEGNSTIALSEEVIEEKPSLTEDINEEEPTFTEEVIEGETAPTEDINDLSETVESVVEMPESAEGETTPVASSLLEEETPQPISDTELNSEENETLVSEPVTEENTEESPGTIEAQPLSFDWFKPVYLLYLLGGLGILFLLVLLIRKIIQSVTESKETKEAREAQKEREKERKQEQKIRDKERKEAARQRNDEKKNALKSRQSAQQKEKAQKLREIQEKKSEKPNKKSSEMVSSSRNDLDANPKTESTTATPEKSTKETSKVKKKKTTPGTEKQKKAPEPVSAKTTKKEKEVDPPLVPVIKEVRKSYYMERSEPEDVTVKSSTMLKLRYFTEDGVEQNPWIGSRNINEMSDGKPRSIGGNGSHFLIFMNRYPHHIAEVQYREPYFFFTPLQKEYFPFQQHTLKECTNKKILIQGKDGVRGYLEFQRYIPALNRINRILKQINHPGLDPLRDPED